MKLHFLFAALCGVLLTPAFSQTYRWANFAGPLGGPGSVDGTGSAARFNYPQGVAVDGSGNVYVADFVNSTIRKITSSGVVTTLAGSAGITGSSDGVGSAARFESPNGLAVDGSGNLYLADSSNNTIRKITSGGVVSTLAGSAGISGNSDGTGSAAQFYHPQGVAVDVSGNLYVADAFNNTIRKMAAGVSEMAAGVSETAAGVSEMAAGVSEMAAVVAGIEEFAAD